MTDGKAMARAMSTISCRSGITQIARVIRHASREHARQKIGAPVVISDACEELPSDLYGAAREVSFPIFMFQEGDDDRVTGIYAEVAQISGGAHCKFDSSAAQRLADLLKAVAVYATGGLTALADQNGEAARLLLTQIKK